MKRPLSIIIVFLFLLPGIVRSQEKTKTRGETYRLEKIKPEDFSKAPYAVDQTAAAVVLADIGSTEIIGNNAASFSLLFRRFRRVHILNRNGYENGTVSIRLYSKNDNEEQLENLKAVTYNLENGKVVESKLDVKNSLYKEQVDRNRMIKKFTFPNMKEGSIIEFEYRIKSDFIFNLQPWEFQGQYPCLWSEYRVAMPSFYNYVTLTQGYHPYYIKEEEETKGSFFVSDTRGTAAAKNTSIDAVVTQYRWVMKDVPALKEENYTSTLRNHISRIEFQLASVGEPFAPKKILASWEMVVKSLNEREDFAQQLSKDNGWLGEAVAEACGSATADIEKAKRIYAWVRDHFSATGTGGIFMEQSLKNIMRNRTGSLPEINLLLTAMLRKAGLNSNPVLLSTRSHGYAHPLYPLMERFNYVISRVSFKDTSFYLDASEADLGFGRLAYKCYNGHARIIGEEAIPVELDASSVVEKTNTMVFIINDEKNKFVGSVQQTPGYFESLRVRRELKGKGMESITTELRKSIGEDITLSNLTIDSATKLDEPVAVKYDIEIRSGEEPVIYFNPLLTERLKENPFKSAERRYPVEMPFTVDETFTLQMEIPKGYEIDELPKGTVIKYNEEGDALFEYRISSSSDLILFRCHLLVKRAYFLPEEYEGLREFYAMIVKKQNEQIVFKKKRNP